MVILFFAFENVLEYLFLQCSLNINRILPQNGQKTITFHISQNRGYFNKSSVATPLLTKNWCFIGCLFVNTNTQMLTKNTTSNQEKSKDEKKGFGRQKKTENPKTERIDEKTNSNLIFCCCSFHATKAKDQGKETKR